MQCPSCHKEVDVKDKDVGALFTCPQCRSVYFINFDGTPDFGEVQQPSVEELQRLQNQAIPEKKKKKKNEPDAAEFELATQDLQPLAEQQVESVPLSFEIEVPSVDLSQNEIAAFELQQAESVIHHEQPSETLNELSSVEPVLTEPLPIEAPSQDVNNFGGGNEDFSSIASELESFGNSQTVVAGISYDLEVTGLDTKEAQELLKEAIEDSRFGWHAEDFSRDIRSGTCQFKNLTPVQAFVLARRIQFIDIEMKWKQNVLA